MHILISALSIFISSYILSGVHVDGFVTAIVVAVVLGLVNMLIKPVVLLLTLPLTILTLGLFTFVVNGLMILLVSKFVPGFRVDGFLWAVLFGLVMSLVSSLLTGLTK
jgi:putative membrane protein